MRPSRRMSRFDDDGFAAWAGGKAVERLRERVGRVSDRSDDGMVGSGEVGFEETLADACLFS